MEPPKAPKCPKCYSRTVVAGLETMKCLACGWSQNRTNGTAASDANKKQH